jgi:hypothetical protein
VPPIIYYPEFRAFQAFRTRANNATSAIQVSTQIGALDVQARIERDGDGALVTTTYPSIPEAREMNVPLSAATGRIEESSSFLASMAIPLVVAVYNEMLINAFDLLHQDGHVAGDPRAMMLGQLRKKLRTAGLTPPSDAESMIDFVQRLRNRIIHLAGVADQSLLDAWTSATAPAKARWTRIAGHPQLLVDKAVVLHYADVKAAYSAVNRSVVEVNQALARKVSRATWARVAVADWVSVADFSQGFSRQDALRKARKYAASRYGPVGLTAAELDAELRATGTWRLDGTLAPRRR